MTAKKKTVHDHLGIAFHGRISHARDINSDYWSKALCGKFTTGGNMRGGFQYALARNQQYQGAFPVCPKCRKLARTWVPAPSGEA
jgi:hypothetical protein